MKKFEYRAYTSEILKNKDGTYDEKGLLYYLSRFGQAGWELVSTEMFDEHVVKLSTDPDKVIKENGEIDYVDNGKKCVLEYDQKKVIFFLKREKAGD